MQVTIACAFLSFVQATAAAQAGVSVIQPNIGRLDDWYHKHPNVIRDPKVDSKHTARSPYCLYIFIHQRMPPKYEMHLIEGHMLQCRVHERTAVSSAM